MLSRLTITFVSENGDVNCKMESYNFSQAEILGLLASLSYDILRGKAHVVRAGKKLRKTRINVS